MSFGIRLTQARKKKGISQEELAAQLKTKGPVIGRYERDEMKPSIEAATKMAKILEVSLDWLVGNTDAELDTATINRIQTLVSSHKKIRNSSLSSLIPLSPIVKLKMYCSKYKSRSDAAFVVITIKYHYFNSFAFVQKLFIIFVSILE